MDSLIFAVDTVAVRLVETSQQSSYDDNILRIVCIYAGVVLLLALLSFLAKKWKFLVKSSKKLLASDRTGRLVWGALIEWQPTYFWLFVLQVLPSISLSLAIPPGNMVNALYLLGLNIAILLTIKVSRRLIDIFNLRKKETGTTWCYVAILTAIGLWITSFVLIFDVKENGKLAAAIGIIGGVLTWIFQDKIKGVVTFFHLRLHHLLNIDDWLIVEKLGVDGEVQKITLTSVIVYNWDTTTSTIPINALQTEHFVNLKSMMDGKTYGRRMLQTFILDTGWFRVLSDDEINQIKKKIAAPEESNRDSVSMNLFPKEIYEGMLNAQLYRLYIYHWLMNHQHISQEPRLIVRWLEQKDGGMPLQVYAFITDSNLAQFEWQQSQIIEHIIKSLDWFGLRLYQSPSAFDVSNSNIYLTKEAAEYRKEVKI